MLCQIYQRISPRGVGPGVYYDGLEALTPPLAEAEAVALVRRRWAAGERDVTCGPAGQAHNRYSYDRVGGRK
jgi:hypothetical protein